MEEAFPLGKVLILSQWTRGVTGIRKIRLLPVPKSTEDAMTGAWISGAPAPRNGCPSP